MINEKEIEYSTLQEIKNICSNRLMANSNFDFLCSIVIVFIKALVEKEIKHRTK